MNRDQKKYNNHPKGADFTVQPMGGFFMQSGEEASTRDAGVGSLAAQSLAWLPLLVHGPAKDGLRGQAASNRPGLLISEDGSP